MTNDAPKPANEAAKPVTPPIAAAKVTPPQSTVRPGAPTATTTSSTAPLAIGHGGASG